MKKTILISLLISSITFFNSCSAEEESSPPPNIVQTPPPTPEPTPVQYTLTVTAGQGGTVSTQGGTYDEGASVTIIATPDEGYQFVGWEGSDSNSNNLSVTLNANIAIQAVLI